MRCPVDESELRITERQGIEIDYCPQCRGVWLDRGELDKILERSVQPGYRSERDRDDDRAPRRSSERDRYDDDYRPPRDDDYGRRGRRRSFLEDILDFD
jgi:Zn-finger nucleic acid-binding protein